MKFQWYVVNLDDATVKGSNDVDEIRELITDSGYIVLTAQHGKYYNGSDTPLDVTPLADEDDDEDEDDAGDGEESPEDAENESGTPGEEDDEGDSHPKLSDKDWPS